MPGLSAQIAMPGARTAEFTVTRALLRPGRGYEEAVRRFQPYERVQDEQPEARAALRAIVDSAQEGRADAFVFVNNRLEGNAPATISAILGVDK